MKLPAFEYSADDILRRNCVKLFGKGEKTLMLAHGFGCDQNMWRFVLPALEKDYKIVLFDYVGSGSSDLTAYNADRYQSLDGYALDVIEIITALNLSKVHFVGHSVSSIIGLLASIQKPELFEALIMVCPSPCFLNFKPEYSGGFEKQDLEELINLMDKNYIGWANYLAPLVMGNSQPVELVNELTASFCSTDPKYSKPFAKATFFSDCRHILQDSLHPSLILQSSNDSLAAVEVGEFMHANLPNSHLEVIEAMGHCLHMTDPDKVVSLINSFMDKIKVAN